MPGDRQSRNTRTLACLKRFKHDFRVEELQLHSLVGPHEATARAVQFRDGVEQATGTIQFGLGGVLRVCELKGDRPDGRLPRFGVDPDCYGELGFGSRIALGLIWLEFATLYFNECSQIKHATVRLVRNRLAQRTSPA